MSIETNFILNNFIHYTAKCQTMNLNVTLVTRHNNLLLYYA